VQDSYNRIDTGHRTYLPYSLFKEFIKEDSIYIRALEVKDSEKSSTSASIFDILLKMDVDGKLTVQL
jgi:hypothetical protein